MAVRIALGAGRGRIVRQLLTESLLLATAGAILGLGAAYAGVRLLLSASKLPRLDAVPFDSHVLLFALGALVVCGVLVGFAPALRLAATDVKTLMNESGRSVGGGRATARWLSAMTVAEVALAIMLVAGAGWLIRGFSRLQATDPGFVPNGRIVFDISLQGPKYRDAPAVMSAFRDLFGRLRGLPGVDAVGSTFSFPLRGGPENSLFVLMNGDVFDPAHPMGARQRIANVGFFDAMGIKLLAGRNFTEDDRIGTTPVAVVNRTFVRQYLAGKDQELGMTLMLLFGAAAVALAMVGIYGVIAYATSQRTGEVATRLALGASSGNVFRLVLRQGRTLVVVGAAIGLLLAYLAGRLVSARIYEVSAADPFILGGATVLVVGIALVATMIPAWRAARLDPARVLRPE
jgi:putative ABC transport system permease protein